MKVALVCLSVCLYLVSLHYHKDGAETLFPCGAQALLPLMLQ